MFKYGNLVFSKNKNKTKQNKNNKTKQTTRLKVPLLLLKINWTKNVYSFVPGIIKFLYNKIEQNDANYNKVINPLISHLYIN